MELLDISFTARKNRPNRWQTDRQTGQDRQTDRQTGRQADRQTDRRTDNEKKLPEQTMLIEVGSGARLQNQGQNEG